MSNLFIKRELQIKTTLRDTISHLSVLTKIRNLDKTQCWQSCGEVCGHCHCWQSVTWSNSMQGTLGMSTNVTAIPLLEISPTDTPVRVWNHLCTKSLIAALFMIAKDWTQGTGWINYGTSTYWKAMQWYERKRKISIYRHVEISRIFLLSDRS